MLDISQSFGRVPIKTRKSKREGKKEEMGIKGRLFLNESKPEERNQKPQI